MTQPDVELDPDDLPQDRLEFMRAYTFISDNPNWMQSALFLAICQFIPIVGPIVTIGYQFHVAESLLQRDRADGYAEFDFNKFPEYLMRGLWPILVSLVLAAVMFVPITFLWVGMLILAVGTGGMAGRGNGDELTFGLVMGGVVIVALVLGLVANLIWIPMSLRAGYSQDFGQAFHFSFVWDFISRMWVETILALVFIIISSIPLMFAGLLCCGIGVYFAMAIVMMAQAHLLDYQLYMVYLAKGGVPIPLKAKPSASGPAL